MTAKTLSKLTCAALAATFITTVDVPHAEAQRRTLLEQWFPQAAERNRQRRVEQLRRTNPELFANERAPAPAPIKKVEGPKFYNYKTEGLVTLALAASLPEFAIADTPSPNRLLGEDDLGVTSEGLLDRESTGSVETGPNLLRREALEGWSLKVESGIADAMKAHYSKNAEYLWVDKNFKPNEAARQMLSALERSDEFGLSPQDYAVEMPLAETVSTSGEEKAGAKFELALSAAVLRYGADAKNGRINPNGLSGYHDFPSYKREYSAVAQAVFGAENASNQLEGLNPGNEKFAQMVAELAELRGQIDADAPDPVKPGTFFKPGQENEELPKVIALIERKASDELKAAHGATLAAYDGRLLFDEPLVNLVRDFQKEAGLGPDGIVGKNTIAKLATASPKAKIEKLVLAMERLRWHPEDLGDRHVFINQPAYVASYMVNGKSSLSMRAVVGKPSNQTYFFYDTIRIVEVNPYWHVPRSIMINQKLEKIRANPGYLAANGYEVVTGSGVTDPYSVDWYSGSLNGVQIRQKPGSNNALGELKILFPNKHAIYMHDTPERNLFSRDSRAYSSGCIRLQQPREMAAAVLGSSVDYVSGQIASGENRAISVKNKIPVYVAYFTAWPNDEGRVGYYADIYGRDKALSEAIEKTDALRRTSTLSES